MLLLLETSSSSIFSVDMSCEAYFMLTLYDVTLLTIGDAI